MREWILFFAFFLRQFHYKCQTQQGSLLPFPIFRSISRLSRCKKVTKPIQAIYLLKYSQNYQPLLNNHVVMIRSIRMHIDQVDKHEGVHHWIWHRPVGVLRSHILLRRVCVWILLSRCCLIGFISIDSRMLKHTREDRDSLPVVETT